jgi:hypothetical protein
MENREQSTFWSVLSNTVGRRKKKATVNNENYLVSRGVFWPGVAGNRPGWNSQREFPVFSEKKGGFFVSKKNTTKERSKGIKEERNKRDKLFCVTLRDIMAFRVV